MNRRALAVIAMGVLLMAPSLWMGFFLDDYIYLIMMEGWGKLPRETTEPLFDLVPADAPTKEVWLRDGLIPWWSSEEVHLYFFRPLSAGLMRVDHALFGRWAAGYHLHSLLWWALLLAGGWLVFRRTLPGGMAFLGLTLFAIDESHVYPVGWIANRNAVVGIAPVVLGLAAHLKWREEGWRPGRFLSLALYGAGLLGGEAALSAMAYPVAYEAFRSGPPASRRSRGLLPLAVLGAVYVAVYKMMGCGAGGSALYIDPSAQPLDYARAALTRIPTLLSGSLAGLPADLWLMKPSLRGALVITGLAAAAITLVLARTTWKRCDAGARRHLGWLLAGSAGALLPVAATFPSDRLSLAASLGLSATLAAIISAGWSAWRSGRRTVFVAGAGLLALVHLAVAPLAGLGIQAALISLSADFEQVSHEADIDPPPAPLDVVLLSAPDHVVGLYLPLQRGQEYAGVLRNWRPLTISPHDHRITRTGDRTIELQVLGGSMMTSLFEMLYRPSGHPLRAGDVLERGLFRVEILAADGVGPTRVRFLFDRTLEDPSLRFLVWRDGRLQRIAVPRIGASIDLPHEIGPSRL